MSPSLGIPRPPIGPDPFRRIDVPKDLSAITTVAEEAPPAAGGLDQAGIDRIWRAVESLYRGAGSPTSSAGPTPSAAFPAA